MGQSSQEAYRSVGRGNVLFFRRAQLTLVTDKAHPLYDARVELPVDRALVDSIKAYGVVQPIVVRKNGETRAGVPIVEVVEGRQRVKAAEVASGELVAEGKEEVLVPAVPRRGDDADLFGVMATSFIRRGEGPIEQAKRIVRFMAMGKSEAEAAVAFGISKTSVRLRLAVIEACAEIRNAVAAEKISVDDAAKLARLPRADQPAALDKALKEKPGKARRRQVSEDVKEPRLRMVGRAKVTRALKRVEAMDSTVTRTFVVELLLWMLGEMKDDERKDFEAVTFS